MSDLKINLQEILQEKQEKIIPENIKKDVQIFDVTGTYEGSGSSGGGDVKLFETEEEMQADSTAQEGDLAVVYREEIQNMTADTQTQYITFPETVVLPEAFTGDVYGTLRAVDESVMFDGQVMLSQSGFNFNGYSETGMIQVSYQSEDGITYTRQEFMGDNGDLTNPVDLGTSVKVYNSEEWNDLLGYFMQTGGNVFDGLYEYGKYAVDGYISIPLINDDYTITSTPSKNVTINNSYNNSFNKQDLIDICKEIEASVSSNVVNSVSLFMKDNKLYACGYIRTYNKQIYLSCLYNEIGEDNTILSNVLVDGGGTSSGTEGEPNFEVKIWKIDINNKSYSLDSSIQYEISYIKSMTVADSYSTRVTFAEPFDTICIKQYYTDVTFPYMWKQVSEDDFDQYGITCGLTYHKNGYQTAPNQYTLTSSNQLLPNISAYGKNENVVGDGSIMTPNNTFTDIPAMLYYNIQKQYDEMEPRILTDEDKEIDVNIYFIPVKSDGTPLLNTSDVTDMSDMFFDCSSLTTIPLLDTSNVTNMSDMFFNCSSLTTIPLLDTSGVTIMSGMFTGCSSLTTIPLLDTSGVTIINHMFNGCRNLTTVPELDTSSATNMNSMFYSCSSLTTIPLLDTSSATNMRNMFDGCSNLTTIPLLDTSSVTDIRRMFSGCSNLTNETLSNILQMLINATSYTNTKTLNYIGLSREQATTCATLSNWAACESAGWTTGY